MYNLTLVKNKYRPDINGLRALAVISVVGFHAFPKIFKGGFIGVDVFFVISGYLITNIILDSLDKNTFNIWKFYSRRIKRIFPALILTLVICYIIGWFTLFPSEYMQLGKHIAGGASFISNFILWQEAGYFDNSNETKPLLHLWSLGIEEQFYIIYPILLYCTSKLKINSIKVICFLFIISFTLNIIKSNNIPVKAFYSPFTRSWELMIGGFIACISKRYRCTYCKFITELQSMFGFLFICITMFVLTKNNIFPGWWALLPTLGTFLIILPTSQQTWVNRNLLSNNIMIWIGLISYPLYLWHWPLLSFAHIIESGKSTAAIRIICVSLSFVLAYLTFKYVETPIRFGRNVTNTIYYLLCLGMIIIGFLGYITYKKKGLKFRPTIKQFVNNKEELVRTAAQDDQCKSYINNHNIVFDYCRYNIVSSGNHQTIALIGDSHAHAAFQGLSELFAQNGINLLLLANSSCPPFVGSVTGINNQQKNKCAAKIDEIIKILIRKKEIKKVIITSMGPKYISGFGFGKKEKTRKFFFSSNINKWFSSSKKEIFRNSLRNTYNILSKAGKKIFYILDIPETGINPAACISRPFKLANRKRCMVPTHIVKSRQKDYRDVIMSLYEIKIIDPINAFCPNKNCYIFDQNESLLYSDSHHLSIAGSRFLAKTIKEDIKCIFTKIS